MPTTAKGTAYTEFTATPPGGELTLWAVPDSLIGTPGIPIVLYTHGASGGYNQFATSSAWTGLREWLIDNGIAWVEGVGGGPQAWGNLAQRNSYPISLLYVMGIIGGSSSIIILGRSMGGLVAYWLATQSSFASQVVGLILSSAVTNLEEWILPPPIGFEFRVAYGLAQDGSNYEEKTAGFHPLEFDPALFAGKNILSLVGDADTTVPPTTNTYPMREHWAGQPAIDRLEVRAGGDHSQGNGTYTMVAPMAAFISDVLGLTPPPKPILLRVLEEYIIVGGKAHVTAPLVTP